MKKTALLIAFFVALFLGYAQAQSQTQPQSQRFISPIPTKTVRLPVGKVDIDPPDIDPALFFTRMTGASDYLLGPEDVIDLKVAQLTELNQTLRISGDGSIDLPYVGIVHATGLTASQLADRIAQLLGQQYLQDPQVTVFVRDFNSQKVSVIGSIQNPGTYTLTGQRTVIQLIAQGGGLRPESGKSVLVFRQAPDGRTARLTIDKEELLVRGNPIWNINLRAGDVINIPSQQMISVSVLGAVVAPGVYTLNAGSDGTLLKAIARAGGLKRASKSGVGIKRKDAKWGDKLYEVDLGKILSGSEPDVILQDGDLIIIKESFF
ncbi:MAG TPA: polysaccharide biosynthesis/export family protein [Acidobacteriota bacterium]|nr:polysaccharide biosynthesis/export family protein [Acidobacteriota bacterium]